MRLIFEISRGAEEASDKGCTITEARQSEVTALRWRYQLRWSVYSDGVGDWESVEVSEGEVEEGENRVSLGPW